MAPFLLYISSLLNLALASPLAGHNDDVPGDPSVLSRLDRRDGQPTPNQNASLTYARVNTSDATPKVSIPGTYTLPDPTEPTATAQNISMTYAFVNSSDTRPIVSIPNTYTLPDPTEPTAGPQNASMTYAFVNSSDVSPRVSIPNTYTLPDPTEPIANSSSPATSTPSTTPAPKISCTYQDRTPEQSSGCVCVSGSSTTTVQPLAIPNATVITQSCDMTTWPGSQPPVTAPPQTVSTNLAGCEICTRVGPSEDDCTPLPASLSCTVASTATTVSMDTSRASVGTLTGPTLFSAVTSAIDSLCSVPPSTNVGNYTCDQTTEVTIASNIEYVDNSFNYPKWDDKGTLTLKMIASNYDSLLSYTIAKTAIAALAQNSTQGNCASTTSYNERMKRDLAAAANNMTSPYPTYSGPYQPVERPGSPSSATYTVCNAGGSFQYIEYDPRSGTPFKELQFELHFQQDPSGDIFCEFFESALQFIETAINVATDTEGALPEEIKLDEDLLKACENSASSKRR